MAGKASRAGILVAVRMAMEIRAEAAEAAAAEVGAREVARADARVA